MFPIPPKPEVTVPFDEMEMAVTAKLDRLARQRIGRRVRYEVHAETGQPAIEVLRPARRLGANLIIMATHGRKGLRRLVLGSVAERVVREARCHVLTISGEGIRVRPSCTKRRRQG